MSKKRCRIMLVGTGPLLSEGSTIMSGQCLRTWHFAAPLIAAGHEVMIYTVPIPGATGAADGPLALTRRYEGHVYTELQQNGADQILPYLEREIGGHRPHILVGVNAWPAYLLARANAELPMWADLNGWTMAEGQTRAALVGNDDDFGHFWRQEAAVILRADRFSTSSQRQAWALQGEMAMLGRLVRENFNGNFVHPVPNAVYPVYTTLERRPTVVPDFVARDLPTGARICLWTGGFNTWTDVPMLLEGLRLAMARNPNLCFVSTGGAVVGHEEETYQRFLVAASVALPPGRWKALGWTSFERVAELHQCARIGISVDGMNIETRFGARNRLTNLMAAGVPVLTTRGTEIAEWMEQRHLGWFVDPGDSVGLAGALSEMVHNTRAADQVGAKAREAALAEFEPGRTVAPLLEWVLDPAPLPARLTPSQEPADAPARLRHWAWQRAGETPPFAPEENSCSPPPTLMGKLRGKLSTLRRGTT